MEEASTLETDSGPSSPPWAEIANRRLADAPDPLTAEELAPLRTFQQLAYRAEQLDEPLEKNLRLLGEEGTLVAATGQQVGLLGGPLYTFAKAVGCIAKAREIEEATGQPTVPVFWIASDDHDFAEASTAWLPSDSVPSDSAPSNNAEIGWQKFEQELHTSEEGQPVFSIRFGRENLNRLSALLGKEGDSDEVDEFSPLSPEEVEGLMRADDLENPYTPHSADDAKSPFDFYSDLAGHGAATLEMTFARLLGEWFAGTGLILLTPRLPVLRRRGCEVLHFELSNPLQRTNQLLQLAEEKAANGEEMLLHRREDAVNLFLFQEGKRVALRFDEEGERFVAADNGAQTWEVEELFELMGTEPWRFSPNVVTRPMVQDIALPTVTYIGGPGERAYLSELETIYAEEDRFFPEVSVRPSLFLVEPKIKRAAENLEIDLAEIAEAAMAGDEAWEALKKRALDSSAFDEMKAGVEASLTQIESVANEMAEAVPGQAVATKRAADKLNSSLSKPAGILRGAIEKDREKLAGDSAERWEKIERALRPLGQPQERLANLIVPFIQNAGSQSAGDGFAHRLRDELLGGGPFPRLIIIETAQI